MCLGYRLALFEIKAILVSLVRSTQFEPVYRPTSGSGSGLGKEEMEMEKREAVRVRSTFAATLQPHVEQEDQEVVPGVKMTGPWLPVRVRLIGEE